MVIELNPDGSGVFKRSMNFNRATEEQRQRIKEFMEMPNAKFGNELLNIEENFPEPFFKVVKNEINKEDLTSYTEIEFQDINRLFAVDRKTSGLQGVGFDIENSNIIFSVKRNTESEVNDTALRQSEIFSNLSAKVTNTFINKSTHEKIGTSYEFIGDGQNAVVDWQGALKFPNHSIAKITIRHSFAKYPVLPTADSDIKTATWAVSSNRADNTLELGLSVPIPVSKDKTYLGYEEKYILSGKYNDATAVYLAKNRYIISNKLNLFNDNLVKECGGRFNLPLSLSFPEKPVSFLDSLIARVRLLAVRKTDQIELGKPLNCSTFESESYKFDIEHNVDKIILNSKMPSNLFKRFLIKTPNGNVMPLKPVFSFNNSNQFKNIPLIQNSTFVVEYYTGAEYECLDIKAPVLNLSGSDEKPAGKNIDKAL